jgi:hypothetical protein
MAVQYGVHSHNSCSTPLIRTTAPLPTCTAEGAPPATTP